MAQNRAKKDERSRRWIGPAVLAAIILYAALVVAVGLGVRFLGPGPATEEEPIYRAQESDWLLLEGEDGEVLPRESFFLRWSDGPEGGTYHIRVMTEELELVAEARRLEQSEFQVPAAALMEFPSGSRIFWQVTAHLPDGRRIDSDSFLAVVE